MLYERYHTREIAQLGGVARKMPILAFFMVVFTFSSIGLPGMNGFAGEILILLGMFQRGFMQSEPGHLRWVAVLAISGVVLGAWYMLWLVQRVFFGKTTTPASADAEIHDLSFREIAALTPLVVFVLWIGLWPQFFLKPLALPVREATSAAALAAESTHTAPAVNAITHAAWSGETHRGN